MAINVSVKMTDTELERVSSLLTYVMRGGTSAKGVAVKLDLEAREEMQDLERRLRSASELLTDFHNMYRELEADFGVEVVSGS